jgi:hypothetical protein
LSAEFRDGSTHGFASTRRYHRLEGRRRRIGLCASGSERVAHDRRVNLGLAAKRIVEHHDQAAPKADRCRVDENNLRRRAPPGQTQLLDLNRPGDRVPRAVRSVALSRLSQKRSSWWNCSAGEGLSDWAVTGHNRNIVHVMLRHAEKAEAVDQLISQRGGASDKTAGVLRPLAGSGPNR